MERGPEGITFTTSPLYRAVCAIVLVGPFVVDAAYRTATQGLDDGLAHWALVPAFAFACWLLAWRPMLHLTPDTVTVRWFGSYWLAWDDVEDVVSYHAVFAPQRLAFVHARGELKSPLPWARSKDDPRFDARLELVRDWWLDHRIEPADDADADVEPRLHRAS